ncbi:ABC transporter substrate-binding protein [Deinococcus sp. KSM4-11]|uniref:ABC transporter substrate-binding protein n=1 Tax=Deinococcus sp. KSM4-11 TaxID=2568654 RepID=UPI001F118299|nr:ABC transporter substrate-binding protein [Deinococcus sp. KSM4-11]
MMRTLSLALLLSAGTSLAAYTGPKVQLTYLHGFTGPDRPIMEKLIAQFNASHPNIEVKGQAQPWGTTWQQLGPLVASGRAADIVAINEDQVTGFIARGALTPLTPAELTAAGIDKARFYGPLWATADYKGMSYGVPVHSVALAMYYNKDLLTKAGVTKVPTNRSEYLAAAQKCTVDKGGKHPGDAGFDAKNLDTWAAGVVNGWMGGTIAYSVTRQNGADLVDKAQDAAFTSPGAQEALQFLVDQVQKYHVSPANATEQSEIAAFRQGKACFNFNGVWMLEQYKGQTGLNFGVTPVPQLGTKMNAAWGGSSHLTLPRQRANYDKNKRAAALEFVSWMTQPAQNLTWTAAGGLPTQPAVAKDKSYDNNPVSGLFEGLPNVYATSGYPWVGQVRGAWDGAVEAAVLGKKTVAQALGDAQKEATKQIEQARKAIK